MELNTKSKDILTQFVNDMSHVFVQSQEPLYWLSADIRVLLRLTKAHHTEAEALAHEFCAEVLKRAGIKATVLISTFNFEFPTTKVFNAEHSRAETGAFGSLLLKTKSSHRLLLPFYSFLVFGYKANELLETEFVHSTGPASIFEWLIERHMRLVAVGHYYNSSLSMIHHSEDVVGVPYRYRKVFSGELVRNGERRTTSCTFLVRDLETCDGSSLTRKGDHYLRSQGIVRIKALGTGSSPIMVYDADLSSIHNELVADLRTASPQYVDYFGPKRPNESVITKDIADQLYLDDIRKVKAARDN